MQIPLQAACWLDMAVTCRAGRTTGSFLSNFGFSSESCSSWLEEKQAEVAGLPQLAAQYSSCGVVWGERDLGGLARVRSGQGDSGQGGITFG